MSSIDYYINNSDAFVQATINITLGELHRMFLAYIPASGKILDAGSGPGRDTKLYSSMGYQVFAMDGSEAMIAYCKQWIGERAVCATFETFHTEEQFDGIWASASFLHVREKDMVGTIERFLGFLKPNGVFYLSYKLGDHSYEKDGRHFTCYTERKLRELINEIHNVSIKELVTTSDVREGRGSELWVNVVVQKT